MNHNFQVIVNKVVGDEAENGTKCNICGRLGTVVILGNEKVCKVCLMIGDVSINRAICPPAARADGGEYVPS